MKTSKPFLSIPILFSLVLSAVSQEPLSQLMEESSTQWMIGNWEGQTDDGSALSQSFVYDLEKRIVISRTTNPGWSAIGITGVDPTTGQVNYTGYSSNGAALSGQWTAEEGVAVLKTKLARAEGEPTELALRYRQVDDKNMVVELLDLDSTGALVEPARGEIKFTRAKAK